MTRREAEAYLELDSKAFDNYLKCSKEIPFTITRGRYDFSKSALESYKSLMAERTILLTENDYKNCFSFALKMAYSMKSSHGTGIRGARSEMQMTDDFMMGILAETAIKEFLASKYDCDIILDHEVHPDHITPQDFTGIKINGKIRECRLNVAVKASKMKSCFNIIPPLEYTNQIRRSDIYIFARVGLPSDHLFRYLRNHHLLEDVRKWLENIDNYKKINELKRIPVWICGYSLHKDFVQVNSIPNQVFEGTRFVVSVADMRNSDADWKSLIKKL